MRNYIGWTFDHKLLYIKVLIAIVAIAVAAFTGLWGIAAIGGVLLLSVLGSLAGFNRCCDLRDNGVKSCNLPSHKR